MKLLLFFIFLMASISFDISIKSSKMLLKNEKQIPKDSLLNIRAWKIIKGVGDEFNTKHLDSTKWKMGLWYDISGDFAFKNENITVKDGHLHLTAKKEIFNGKEYTIGAIESKFEMPAEPSLIRVRAKLLADTVNVCSAIWLQSWPTVTNNPNPEIDIIEYFTKYEMHMNLFTWNKDTAGKYEHVDFNGKIFNYQKDLSENFHIYGFARVNNNLSFYFDDRLVCTWTPPNASFLTMPRHVILSLEGHRYQPKVSMLPASFDIDWVRIYSK